MKRNLHNISEIRKLHLGVSQEFLHSKLENGICLWNKSTFCSGSDPSGKLLCQAGDKNLLSVPKGSLIGRLKHPRLNHYALLPTKNYLIIGFVGSCSSICYRRVGDGAKTNLESSRQSVNKEMDSNICCLHLYSFSKFLLNFCVSGTVLNSGLTIRNTCSSCRSQFA